MVRPNWEELDMLFYGYFNWENSWNIHMNNRFMGDMMKKTNQPLDVMSDIDCLENTFAELVRHTIYGNNKLCV